MRDKEWLRQLAQQSRARIVAEDGHAAQPDGLIVRYEDFQTLSLAEIYQGLRSAKFEHITSFLIYVDKGHTDRTMFLDFTSQGVVKMSMCPSNARPYKEEKCRAILADIFDNVGGELGLVKYDGMFDHVWDIAVTIHNLSVRVEDLHHCQTEVIRQLTISTDLALESTGPWTVLSQLRETSSACLVGLPEAAWIEFKMRVDLDTERGKVELAQDVTRFANSDRAALLVVGVRTERVDKRDTARSITPVQISDNRPDRYWDVIDGRVYPPIRGLEIEQIAAGDSKCIVAILIPAQREFDKPFLVHGAIVDGKTERSFFSIVRRRGEGSVPVSAREVHALLSAGYRLLRPEQFPPPE